MSDNFMALAHAIQRIATTAPAETVAMLANTIRDVKREDWAYARSKVSASISSPALRRQVEDLLDIWRAGTPEVDGTAIALALLAATESEQSHRGNQSVDLVWTGPDSRIIPLRRTEQALLQIINSATTRLLIVSFAVYKVEAIIKALVRATKRGTQISVCVESADVSEGKVAFDAIRAFGEEIREHARFYIWPLDKRMKSPDDKHGSLHTKAAVADSRILLVSSANMTEYAMNLNMELGVLIQGGELPGQAERHFEKLIEQRVFELVSFH